MAWKVSKYGVISGPYFLVFGPEITPYFDTFHAVQGWATYGSSTNFTSSNKRISAN